MVVPLNTKCGLFSFFFFGAKAMGGGEEDGWWEGEGGDVEAVSFVGSLAVLYRR